MTILTVLLTIILICDSLFLGLLILVQLPKKEAGMGMAFGGGAADALFGAGSGTALSTLTKYSAILFFVLVFSLSILSNRATTSNVSDLKKALQAQASQPLTPPTSPTTTPAAVPAAAIPAVPMAVVTNAEAAVAAGISNAAAKAK